MNINERYSLIGIDAGFTEEEMKRLEEVRNTPRLQDKLSSIVITDPSALPKAEKESYFIRNWVMYLKRVREEYCYGEWNETQSGPLPELRAPVDKRSSARFYKKNRRS